jgi:hypothetical protein
MKYMKALLLAALAFLFASSSSAQSGKEHAYFEDTSNDVHEIFYNGAWQDYNLTSLSGAGTAAAGSALSSFSYTSGGCSCTVDTVNYLDSSGDMHQLSRTNGTVTDTDYTSASSATTAASGSPLINYAAFYSLYVDGSGNLVSVNTVSGGGHNDLNVGAPSASATSLTSFNFNSYTYIVYLTTGGDIETVYSNGGAWSHADLTTSASAPAAASGSGLTSFVYGTDCYVVYFTSGGHVEVLYFDSGSWHKQDLTNTTSAPSPYSTNALTSSVFGSDIDIVYVGGSLQVEDIYYDSGSWHKTDLTSVTSAPSTAAAGSALAMSVTGSVLDVYYQQNGGDIAAMYYSAGWYNNDLTSTASAAAPANGTGVSGYDY